MKMYLDLVLFFLLECSVVGNQKSFMSKIHEINATAIQNIETCAQKESKPSFQEQLLNDKSVIVHPPFTHNSSVSIKKQLRPTMNGVFKAKNGAYCLVQVQMQIYVKERQKVQAVFYGFNSTPYLAPMIREQALDIKVYG